MNSSDNQECPFCGTCLGEKTRREWSEPNIPILVEPSISASFRHVIIARTGTDRQPRRSGPTSPSFSSLTTAGIPQNVPRTIQGPHTRPAQNIPNTQPALAASSSLACLYTRLAHFAARAKRRCDQDQGQSWCLARGAITRRSRSERWIWLAAHHAAARAQSLGGE
jgi:hypothetical protein